MSEKTLLELWRENPPGTKFRGGMWDDGDYIIPCQLVDYPDGTDLVCLRYTKNRGFMLGWYTSSLTHYRLFDQPSQPKPKVKRAQYIINLHEDERPMTTDHWYKDDADLYKEWGNEIEIIARIEEREFEE